jgi:hypothetical protein
MAAGKRDKTFDRTVEIDDERVDRRTQVEQARCR